MTSTRIKDCKSADILKIVKRIERFHKSDTEQNIDIIIKNEAEFKTQQLVATYDVDYCKTIIVNHVKGNIYELVGKFKVKTIDMSNEKKFYRQMIYPYIYEVVYTKIKNAYYRISDETYECSICLDMIDYKSLYTTQCNHKFHKACHMKWMKHNGKSCPNCRKWL